MVDVLPEYNETLGKKYATEREQFLSAEIGTPQAAAILTSAEKTAAELFGYEYEPAPLTDNPNLINNISKWLVSGMIQAVFYDDLSSIGEGTPEELNAAYGSLIAQYHDACKNEQMKAFVRIKAQIEFIEYKWKVVELISGAMQARYSEVIAGKLREMYPAYTFSPETIVEDFRKVGVGEIATKRTYDMLQTQLEKLGVSKDANEKQTPLERHTNFLARLAEIEKYKGVVFDVNTRTVLDLAVHENMLSDYIEQLQEQTKRNGSAD